MATKPTTKYAATRLKPSELVPVPWDKIEPHYRAGLSTLTEIGRQFGVSRAGIIKYARRHAWVRDLRPAILAASDRVLSEAQVTQTPGVAVTHQVTPQPLFSDQEIVDAGAQQLTLVRMEHRADIAALRSIVAGLMRELAVAVNQPEALGMIFDALANPDEPALHELRDMAALVASLPQRTKVARDLADALYKAIGMEREAFGLNTDGGADGRPTVIIKDYTGRGSVEAPPMADVVDV